MAAPSLAPGLARKVKKVHSTLSPECIPCREQILFSANRLDQTSCCCMQILEMRTESPEILGSLATMSSLYEDNTPAARRQLCATIEKQGLSITQQYLQSAELVVQVQALRLSPTE